MKNTNLELFPTTLISEREIIGIKSSILRGFALPYVEAALTEIQLLTKQSAFRNMKTPGGFTMSVAMTNCGKLGWTTDRTGYHYKDIDPETGLPWPPMPDIFIALAKNAASAGGFENFEPDACLINRYLPGSKLSLHQDKNEKDFSAPIVSVSLGLPAVFLFGGQKRTDKTTRFNLMHGDVIVWGGPDRLKYHGILPLKTGEHMLLGQQRINFTFRKAG